MPVYSPPPVEPVTARMTLGDRTVDLASRALAVAVVPSPRWARESEVISGVHAAADAGADLVEVPADPKLLGPAAQAGGPPVAARVATAPSARAALAAGAGLLLVPAENLDLVRAGEQPREGSGAVNSARPHQDINRSLAVMVQEIGGVRACRAALSSSSALQDSISSGAGGEVPVAFDTLHLTDVDLVAETTLALSLGARIVRTHDIRKVRRVIEVIASLLEARS